MRVIHKVFFCKKAKNLNAGTLFRKTWDEIHGETFKPSNFVLFQRQQRPIFQMKFCLSVISRKIERTDKLNKQESFFWKSTYQLNQGPNMTTII